MAVSWLIVDFAGGGVSGSLQIRFSLAEKVHRSGFLVFLFHSIFGSHAFLLLPFS